MIIFINGPPRSGKTTAIHHITSLLPNCAHYRMAMPIDRAMPELLQIQPYAWRAIDDGIPTRGYKDDGVIFGKTPRELKIALSSFLKSMLGEAIFGEIAMIAMRGMIFGNILIDIGFTIEAEVIVRKAREIGQLQCVCIQLEREGCSFENDSREYIDCEKLGIPVKRISNRHELEMFYEQLNITIREWLPHGTE